MPRDPQSTHKPVALTLPPETHLEFRIAASRQNLSMSALARKLAEEHVAAQQSPEAPAPGRRSAAP